MKVLGIFGWMEKEGMTMMKGQKKHCIHTTFSTYFSKLHFPTW
jgi:hypothetical protein